jgi:hypothetical protein
MQKESDCSNFESTKNSCEFRIIEPGTGTCEEIGGDRRAGQPYGKKVGKS